MNYSMTSPCDMCPFLDKPNMRRTFTVRRLREFADNSTFPCHKTAEVVEEEDGGSGGYEAKESSAACAGALIYNMKHGRPNQMMRIAGRLGMFDPSKLNMKAGIR